MYSKRAKLKIHVTKKVSFVSNYVQFYKCFRYRWEPQRAGLTNSRRNPPSVLQAGIRDSDFSITGSDNGFAGPSVAVVWVGRV